MAGKLHYDNADWHHKQLTTSNSTDYPEWWHERHQKKKYPKQSISCKKKVYHIIISIYLSKNMIKFMKNSCLYKVSEIVVWLLSYPSKCFHMPTCPQTLGNAAFLNKAWIKSISEWKRVWWRGVGRERARSGSKVSKCLDQVKRGGRYPLKAHPVHLLWLQTY